MRKNKQKLGLENLSIDSFVTDLSQRSEKTVKGGFIVSNEITGCTGVCCGTLTTSGHSGAFGPQCESKYPNCIDHRD